jgi:vacuolar-type H+-ATPase subunit I/STV1
MLFSQIKKSLTPIIHTNENRPTYIHQRLPDSVPSNILLPDSSSSSEKSVDDAKMQSRTDTQLEDLQPMQKEPAPLRRSKRLHGKAQQGTYIEEIPETYFGEALEHDFCLVAFEIDEDELLVHSNELSFQNSGEQISYVENIIQSTTLKPDEEKRVETKGEEQSLNEPFTYEEAMKAPDADRWIEAMKFELDVLKKMRVWEVTQPPANTNIMGSKWVYRYKYNPQGLIIKRRACLVAQGFTQVISVDYEDTFSPVICLSSLRLICALAA